MNLKEVNDLVYGIQEELEKEMLSITLTLDENGNEIFAVWGNEVGKGYETATIKIAKMNAEQIRSVIRRTVGVE